MRLHHYLILFKYGQYLLITRNGKCDAVTKPATGDMAFIADNMYANDNIVTLKGNKRADNGPHCCPSAEGTLDYNAVTKQYSFKLHKIKQHLAAHEGPVSLVGSIGHLSDNCSI
jgi:hypothetical protein